MKKKVVPVTENWNKLTEMLVIDKDGTKINTDYHFEPGFKKKKDGTLELLEISLVKNKK